MSIHYSFVWPPADGGDSAIIYVLLYLQGPRDYLPHLAPWRFLNENSYIVLVDFLNNGKATNVDRMFILLREPSVRGWVIGQGQELEMKRT